MKRIVILSLALILTACASQRTVQMMSYNIRNGKGMDGERDLERIARVIRQSGAQIVALQEIDSLTQRSGRSNVMQELASLTGLNPSFASAIPYQGGAYGIGILSVQKPISCQRIPLPGAEEARVLLLADFGTYAVACTHWSLTQADRAKSVEIIKTLFADIDKPIILAGDLNCLPQSAEIAQMSDLLQLLNNPGQLTFPSNIPDRCIDYLFGTKDKVKVLDCKVYQAAGTASDHLPIYARLKIRP